MMDTERSTSALILALAAVALLGFALAAPWLAYQSNSGRRTPAGGYQDPSDTGITQHAITYRPFHVAGDEPATDGQAAQRWATLIGWTVVGALACLAVPALANLPRLNRAMPRWLALGLLATGTLAAAAALAMAWILLPATLSGYGIDGPFTAKLTGDVYVRSTLALGWVAAALAVPLGMVAFGLQFQAGSTDPALIKAYANAPEPEGP